MVIRTGNRGGAQLGQMAKTRQKLDLKKFVKLTGHTDVCNILTNFEY
jgi:hypothetical protein